MLSKIREGLVLGIGIAVGMLLVQLSMMTILFFINFVLAISARI